MNDLLADVRTAMRSLRRRGGLTAAIVASLALGLGASTAVFSVARAVLWSSLPVQDPDRLVLLQWVGETWPRGLGHSGIGVSPPPGQAVASRSLPYPWFVEMRERPPAGSELFAFAPLGTERQHVILDTGRGVERVAGEMVSGNYFSCLGLSSASGRLLTRDDERQGARVAVISHEIWRRRFSGDASIAGRLIDINQVPFTVVGVAPPGFLGLQPGWAPDVWIPVLDDARVAPWSYRPPDGVRDARTYWWAQVMARLDRSADRTRTLAALDDGFRRFVSGALPDAERSRLPHLTFEPGGGGLDRLRQLYERPLRLLLLMAGVVLIIASANVALLLLARGVARRREFALRLSLGAPRGRLVRQLLVESGLMALAGGVLGVIAAAWTSYALVILAPADNRPTVDAPLDAGTFLFAGLAALFAALCAGLVPAFVATRVELMPAVKRPGSGTSTPDDAAHRIWSSTFIVAQLALALCLLVAAGLLIRSVVNLQTQSIGLDAGRLLVAGIDAPAADGGDLPPAARYERVLRTLRALPGVESATASRLPLLSGWISTARIAPEDASEPLSVQAYGVSAEFARTVGLPLLAGRDLRGDDMAQGRRMVLLSEAAALRLFGAVQVEGREVFVAPGSGPLVAHEIVGVVGNMKDADLRAPSGSAAVFLPHAGAWGPPRTLYIYLRATGDPGALADAVRESVRRADPAMTVFELAAMDTQVRATLWRERLIARLLAGFGTLALALACMGLYGTLSHAVGRRRGEMAVRMALGAKRMHVEWLVVRSALILVATGLAAGAVIIAAGGRWISPWLFGVTPLDPLTLTASAGILAFVGLLAASLPSRVASGVDPAIALREE